MNGPSQTDEERMNEEAAIWHVASCRDDMDWDGFTLWLEADARHRLVYDQLALADSALDRHRQALGREAGLAETMAPRAIRPWRLWGIGAVAAALVAAFMLPALLRNPETVFATGDTSRSIALTDGSQVLLAPHSRLVARGERMEHLALSGGAWFAVRHDPARALDITAGSVVIRDIGTHFDVQSDGAVVRVAVADGTVTVGAEALNKPIELTGGKSLRFDPAAGLAEVASVDPSGTGSWRTGQLRYDNAPLALVAADLARYGKVRLDVPPELRDRRFTGILTIRNEDRTIRDLAQLMDLSVLRGADGYHLSTGHN